MSTQKPPWWRAFDKVERAIGGPLEQAAASNRYVDVMIRGMRIQAQIGGTIGSVAGAVTERVLKAANVPTRSDIRRLSRQLAVLTGEVRELSAEQRERDLALSERSSRPAAAVEGTVIAEIEEEVSDGG